MSELYGGPAMVRVVVSDDVVDDGRGCCMGVRLITTAPSTAQCPRKGDSRELYLHEMSKFSRLPPQIETSREPAGRCSGAVRMETCGNHTAAQMQQRCEWSSVLALKCKRRRKYASLTYLGPSRYAVSHNKQTRPALGKFFK